MASKKKSGKRKKNTRTAADYIESARNLSALVPSLRKFKHRKTLKKSEKASIRRRERQLKNIPYLVPVTKSQAKKLTRKKLFLPGIQAIQLRNVAEGAKIKFTKHGDVEIIAPEGRWIYWSLDRETVRSRRGMRKAGTDAFDKRFPIEKVSDLTAKAFSRYYVQQVQLWAHAGIVGDAFHTINEFIMWVNEKWNAGRYMGQQARIGGIYENPSDPGKWVNGIAILVEDKEYTRKRKALENEQSKPKRKRKAV